MPLAFLVSLLLTTEMISHSFSITEINWLCEFIAFVLEIRIQHCLEFWTLAKRHVSLDMTHPGDFWLRNGNSTNILNRIPFLSEFMQRHEFYDKKNNKTPTWILCDHKFKLWFRLHLLYSKDFMLHFVSCQI